MTVRPITIAGRRVGPGEPVYVVAEMSANHCGSYDRAEGIVRAAKDAGADAVKLQTFTADTITIDCDRPEFRAEEWSGRTLHDLYAEAAMPWEWQPKLKAVADEVGIDLFSTPFDATAVDFLEEMGVPAYKVASFEVTDIPFLKRIGATGKPVIMSTGMANLAEIMEAVEALRDGGATEIALLRCVSAYPAEPSEMNLRSIPNLESLVGVPVGLSDHTKDSTVALTAVALGACILEKHVKASPVSVGIDAEFSVSPGEFMKTVYSIRRAERALGMVRYGPTDGEKENRHFRRSLYVVRDVAAGDVFTPENVRSIRPGFGLHTRHLDYVLGKTAEVDVVAGTPLEWSMVG